MLSSTPVLNLPGNRTAGKTQSRLNKFTSTLVPVLNFLGHKSQPIFLHEIYPGRLTTNSTVFTGMKFFSDARFMTRACSEALGSGLKSSKLQVAVGCIFLDAPFALNLCFGHLTSRRIFRFVLALRTLITSITHTLKSLSCHLAFVVLMLMTCKPFSAGRF